MRLEKSLKNNKQNIAETFFHTLTHQQKYLRKDHSYCRKAIWKIFLLETTLLK